VAPNSENALPGGLYLAYSTATEHSKSEKFLLSAKKLSWLKVKRCPPPEYMSKIYFFHITL
jgi:hypothetical protein